LGTQGTLTSRDVDVVALRFGRFELDLRTGELWRAGVRVRLQNQPYKVLALLARRPGELVTREELRHELWPEGTFVDFEQSLNFCVRQIRSALGDQAATPRYVETLPRRGYRFIAPVEAVRGRLPREDAPPDEALPQADEGPEVIDEPTAPLPDEPLPTAPPARPSRAWAAILAVVLLFVAGAIGWTAAWRRPVPAAVPESAAAPPDVPQFDRITFRRGYVRSARFGPAGTAVMVARWDGQPTGLQVTNVATQEERSLGIPALDLFGVTETGDVIVRDLAGGLSRASLSGGAPAHLIDDVAWADVTRDGSTYAVVRWVNGGATLEFPLGRDLGPVVQPTNLRISPDGERIAFLEHPVRDDDRGEVVVVESNGQRKVLSAGWASADGLAWSPDGREVWFTAARLGAENELRAVDLEGRERALFPAVGRLVLHDVDGEGRLLLERNSSRIEAAVGRVGSAARDLTWMDATTVADLSADGRQLLFAESGAAGGADYSAFLRSTDGGTAMRVGPGRPLALAPDGRWVASVPARAPGELHLLPVGTGTARVLRHDAAAFYDFVAWLPDGRLFYTARNGAGQVRSWVREADGEPTAVTPEGSGVFSQGVSTDGMLVASTRDGPRLVSLDGSQPPREVPGLGEDAPLAWLGRDLVVRERRRGVPSPVVLHRLKPDGRREPFAVLEPADQSGLVGVGPILISEDGRTYAYSNVRRWSELYLVQGL
jgi:DNA-binding winged helix-turn-helix (wHTH) protein